MPIYFSWLITALLSVGGDTNNHNLPQSGRLLYCVTRRFINNRDSRTDWQAHYRVTRVSSGTCSHACRHDDAVIATNRVFFSIRASRFSTGSLVLLDRLVLCRDLHTFNRRPRRGVRGNSVGWFEAVTKLCSDPVNRWSTSELPTILLQHVPILTRNCIHYGQPCRDRRLHQATRSPSRVFATTHVRLGPPSYMSEQGIFVPAPSSIRRSSSSRNCHKTFN